MVRGPELCPQNPEQRTMNHLKTAVLGLGENGRLLLEAASKIDLFKIQAVADKDTTIVESLAAEYDCAAYDDYRQLIIQNHLDCLLVAAGMYSCQEYVRAAMKKKFNVLKLSPAARNFEEAAQFVRLAEAEDVKFSIATTRRFAESFLALRRFLQQDIVEPHLITATCSVGAQPISAWQSDPKLAGGGVLLRNCYSLIDQLTWNFAVPQQVYSLNTNTAGDRQQRLYLTEDTAVVTMKFSDNFFVNIITGTTLGPEQMFLKIYGKDKIITVSDSRFIISDPIGRPGEESRYNDDESTRLTAVLTNFALSILLPGENKLSSSGRENLMNMAVVESAYLSARTGFPEEPGRILKMAQIERANI